MLHPIVIMTIDILAISIYIQNYFLYVGILKIIHFAVCNANVSMFKLLRFASERSKQVQITCEIIYRA